MLSVWWCTAQTPETAPADSLHAEPAKEAVREITEETGAEPEKEANSEVPPEEESPEKLWDAAATAYLNGNYHKAVVIYKRLADRNLSSYKLYYNLGNAYFKEDEIAKAILYYHRALKLAPGEEDIRYNLSVAETKVKDTIEKIPEFFLSQWFTALRRTMSCTAWTIFSLVALIVALSLCLMYLLARRMTLRKVGFYGTLLSVVVFIFTTWFALGERRSMLDRSDAVVMTSSLAVKSSPDRSSTDLFVLHAGTTLKIRHKLDGWCEINIADGKKGWVEEHKIEVI